MSTEKEKDQAPAAAVDEAMRGLSVETGFFLDAVATRLGMGQTDLTCLTVLIREGPATPGWIVDRTGLTSGAVTGVIDRLERAGWVEREPIRPTGCGSWWWSSRRACPSSKR